MRTHTSTINWKKKKKMNLFTNFYYLILNFSTASFMIKITFYVDQQIKKLPKGIKNQNTTILI